jgi:hypothetical protein
MDGLVLQPAGRGHASHAPALTEAARQLDRTRAGWFVGPC